MNKFRESEERFRLIMRLSKIVFLFLLICVFASTAIAEEILCDVEIDNASFLRLGDRLSSADDCLNINRIIVLRHIANSRKAYIRIFSTENKEPQDLFITNWHDKSYVSRSQQIDGVWTISYSCTWGHHNAENDTYVIMSKNKEALDKVYKVLLEFFGQ
jgi:hypothetical protein